MDPSILNNICKTLNCQLDDISGIEAMNQGLTNHSFRFCVRGQKYVYRHPGAGTDQIINRANEAAAEAIARDLGLDSTFVYEDPTIGWKISRFIENAQELDYHDEDQVRQALSLGRKLHESGETLECFFDLMDEAEKIIDLIMEHGAPPFEDFLVLRNAAAAANERAKNRGQRICLCHNDFYSPNFLVTSTSMELIDWEYSGMSDYASDLGTFICCCSDFDYEDALNVLSWYFEREPNGEELLHCISMVAVASFYWFVWAIYRDICGEPVGDYLDLWYRMAWLYSRKSAELSKS